MGGDLVGAELFRQVVRDPLRQAPGVYKYQRRAMLFDQFHQAVINLVPHFVAGDGAELAGGNFNGQVELSFVADVDDDRIRAAVAGEEMGHFFNRFLGGRKSNAHWPTMGQLFQPLERESQVSATFVIGDGMDFIEDHGLNVEQDGPALLRREQDVERLWRGYQNMGWTLQHGPALVHEGIAGADRGPNLRHQKSALARQLQNFTERDLEILLDVV